MATHTYSLTLSYTVAGQFAQNILHYQFDDSGFSSTAAAAKALANAWIVANEAAFKAMLPSTTTINSYKGRALNVTGGFEGIVLPAAPVAGTNGTTQQASGLCPVIILYPIANSKQRGRVFLPGVAKANIVAGQFTTGFVSSIDTNKHVFVDPLTLTGGGAPVATPVIYSRTPFPPLSRVIEFAELSPMVGQMRRRQRPA